MSATEPHLSARPSVERRDVVCPEHGQYEAFRWAERTWSTCAQCDQVAERAQQRIAASGLLGRFTRATLDSFVCSTNAQRKVVSQCRAFVADLHDDAWCPLLLIGPPGTGKTHLGAALTRATIIDRRKSAHMMTARELVRELRATWRKDAEDTEEEIIDGYGRLISLLVLDELGVGFGSEAELVQLLDVVDRRYQLQLPTVFISNLSIPLLRTALGDRLFDRINESSRVLVCNWATFRQPMRDAEHGSQE